MLKCVSADNHGLDHRACGCIRPELGRRGLISAASMLLGLGVFTRPASAASGDYEAMLVNCIDPRFTTSSLGYMAASGMRDRYSQFVVAGGPIGAVHPRFASWHSSFWDNLDITVQLHSIKQVVAVTHRDCGAAKLAFGDAAVATRHTETAAHAEALRAFAAEVRRRKPKLAVMTGIMDLNGSVEAVN